MSKIDKTVLKPSELRVVLSKLIPAKAPILITGAPGVGKTDIIKQACKDADAEIIIAHPVVDDPIDYKGLPFIVDGNAEFLPIGNLNSLINATKLTVFFLDDLGQAPPAVQAACMQLILERRINEHKISDHVVFVAATNRKEDRAGVTGILEPVKSRFVTIVELQPNKDDWMRWAIDNKLPTQLLAFIEYRPNLLWDFKPTPDLTNTPCPRTIAHVAKIMQLGLPSGLEFATIAGAVGEGFAVEFDGFRRYFSKLPDPQACLADPENANIPKAAEDPAIMYAFSSAIAEYADKKYVKNFFTLIERFEEPEFAVLAINMAMARHPNTIRKADGYKKFLASNSDLFFG